MKTTLRQQIKTKRQELDDSTRRQAAQACTDIFINHSLFLQQHNFACFFSHGSELDTSPLINEILHQHGHCYFPVIDPQTSQDLLFIRYQSERVESLHKTHSIDFFLFSSFLVL